MSTWEPGRGSDYVRRFEELAASGANVHGEVDLLITLISPGARVLDAGCGTGRVAIELAHRGYDVVGVDLDPSMLEQARLAAPEMEWVEADLTSFAVASPVDLAVLAGNVMIFIAEGTEQLVLDRVASVVRPGGLVVAGFSLGRLPLERYDECATSAGLELVDRFGTWDREPFAGGDYAVSIHRSVA